MAKRAAKKVAGRNAMVITAMVFIAEESALAASAISLLTSAWLIFIRASSWVNSAKIWLRQRQDRESKAC